MMHYHRGLLFWGLALITGGAVALAAEQGYLDRDLLAGAWRLWPLILVAIGVAILVSRTPFAIIGTILAALVVGGAGGALIAVGPGVAACGGSDPTDLTTRQGTFGDTARVQLEFNCGTLNIGMESPRLVTATNTWTVATGQSGGSPPQIDAGPDRLDIRSRGHDNWFTVGQQLWNVSLPPRPRLQLEVKANAADTHIDLTAGTFTAVSIQPNAGSLFLDLTNTSVEDLTLSLNAGSASISVGEGADVSGVLTVNAGSIELCTEGAVALRFTMKDNFTFSHNLAELGFGHDGDRWSYSPPVPPGVAVSFVDLRIEGNAASFTLNPEGGCS